jgi:hypothetical protein
MGEVDLADEGREGFAQLAYHLIELGSHVIERRLIGITESHSPAHRRVTPNRSVSS